jgi:hypothetical protein
MVQLYSQTARARVLCPFDRLGSGMVSPLFMRLGITDCPDIRMLTIMMFHQVIMT